MKKKFVLSKHVCVFKACFTAKSAISHKYKENK